MATTVSAQDEKTVVELIQQGKVPVHEFARIYDQHRSIEKQSPRFAVLDVEHNGAVEAVPAAVRLAVEDDFFVDLFVSLIVLVTDPDKKPALTAVTNNLANGTNGEMQAVLRAAGLRDVETLPALVQASKATALITVDVPGVAARAFGTGFLVTPTLLLTAAHVVEPLIENLAARNGSDGQATIQFRNKLGGSGEWPIKARLDNSWLVSISPPNGAGGKIQLTPAAETAEKLDFALIRLSEPVGNIAGVVDIVEPPEPEINGRLTVIGYDGGTRCVFDDQLLRQHDADASRIRYDTSTVGGMSGGPCIDSKGRAVGIHEGSMDNANPKYNRAVYLRAVRGWMKKSGADPLVGDSGPLWQIQDRDARRDWVRAGETLIGLTPAQRTDWLDEVAALNPDDPREVSQDIMHPVFGRDDLLTWIQNGCLGNASRRIALISGPKGSGKSFTAHIVRYCLPQSRHQVVVVPPTEIRNNSLKVPLNFISRQLGIAETAGDSAAVRPAAGVLRRDLLPDTFDALKSAVQKRSGQSGLLWLVVDLGDDSTLTEDSLIEWKQLVIEAEKRDWVRLVITGLTNAQRGEVRAAAAKPVEVETKSLAPITADEFRKTIVAQAKAIGVDSERWGDESVSLWDQKVEALSPIQGRSVVAVRLALETRNQMTQAVRAAEAAHP